MKCWKCYKNHQMYSFIHPFDGGGRCFPPTSPLPVTVVVVVNRLWCGAGWWFPHGFTLTIVVVANAFDWFGMSDAGEMGDHKPLNGEIILQPEPNRPPHELCHPIQSIAVKLCYLWVVWYSIYGGYLWLIWRLMYNILHLHQFEWDLWEKGGDWNRKFTTQQEISVRLMSINSNWEEIYGWKREFISNYWSKVEVVVAFTLLLLIN